MRKYIVYADGAARGNPGSAAAAFVIKSDDGVIWTQSGKFLGRTTNNFAEYSAVLEALKKLKSDFLKYLPGEIEVRVDSQLAARQLSGRYKVKNKVLKILYDQIKVLEFDLGRVSYKHVPRKENFLADRLANKILDEQADERI